MPAGTIQPLNPLRWLVGPSLLCAMASVLLALPVRVFGLQPPEPVFAMAPAFAWAVIRPSVLPPFALAGLGLFQDVLWGGPLGLWPVCLLTLYALAFAARPVLSGQGFWTLGAWYVAACASAFGVAILLTLLASGVVASLVSVGLQALVTILLFPLAWRLVVVFEDADVRFR